nr:hypothetical protein [Tanacetum cinerariifolium]
MNTVGSTEPLEKSWISGMKTTCHTMSAELVSSHKELSSACTRMIGDWVSGVVSVLLGDDASWSTIIVEGEPVDAAGSGATTLAIGAMTSGVGHLKPHLDNFEKLDYEIWSFIF